MSVIGEQIKLYRIENNMTQETLGQLVGVTTQAISRWERGGTPDAELLPRIAEVLGVSVDALFGLEKQNIAVSLARRLCGMTQAEAFRYAFDVCWAIEVGLAGNASAIDDFVNRFAVQSIVSDEQTKDYFAKTVLNEGMANARISPGLSHFFLMLQPKEGVGKCLSDFESLRRVFALLADEKLLRIIFYVYSLPLMPVATALIAKNVGLDVRETDRCMQQLCACKLFTRSVVATLDGEINAYTYRRESFALPLLCFADELAGQDARPFFGDFKRDKPLL